MPEEQKSPRPKLIVPGAEEGEKKSRVVVTPDAESSKPQVLLPGSGDAGKSRTAIVTKSDEGSVPLSKDTETKVPVLQSKVEDEGNAGPKIVVKPMSSPPQEGAGAETDEGEANMEAGNEAATGEVEQVVDMGPAPEQDGISDIVGAVGLSEEVIAELDEVAEREERARIAEQERIRAIEEANRRAEEQQRAREEEQRAREAEEAARQKNEQAPYGYAMPGQSGYPQQGYPATHPGYGYPHSHQGMPRPPQGVAEEPGQRPPAMEVKPPSGIPGWALYMIGFLSGALILLVLFMATPMGEGLISKSLVRDGWKPPVKRVASPGVERRGSGGHSPLRPSPLPAVEPVD
jgi:hypothetical protein